MSIRKSFVYGEVLRRRKHLGILGWVSLAILLVFALDVGGVGWRVLTQHPAPLATGQATLPTSTVLTSTSDVLRATTAPNGSASWTVWKAKDPLGQEIWDGPSEIKQAVVHDYLASLTWTDAHMFDLSYLQQHLDEYYTGKRLAEMREIVQWEIKNNKVIAISSVKRLPAGTLVGTFSADGLQATLLDYNAANRGQTFDLTTRKPIAGAAYPNTMHLLQLEYDAAAQRWKIAHALLDYDLEARHIIWKEEWDRAK